MGLTVAWGAWSGFAETEARRERIERQLAVPGSIWITPRKGLDGFGILVRPDAARAAGSAVDWQVFAEGIDSRKPFLEELLSKNEGDTSGASLRADLLSQFPDFRHVCLWGERRIR